VRLWRGDISTQFPAATGRKVYTLSGTTLARSSQLFDATAATAASVHTRSWKPAMTNRQRSKGWGRVFGTPLTKGQNHAGAGVDQDDDPRSRSSSAMLVDFSFRRRYRKHDLCVKPEPMVIGTTGLEPAHHAVLDTAATSIPVLQTGNTSVGVTPGGFWCSGSRCSVLVH
jgi:hypothetical protein